MFRPNPLLGFFSASHFVVSTYLLVSCRPVFSCLAALLSVGQHISQIACLFLCLSGLPFSVGLTQLSVCSSTCLLFSLPIWLTGWPDS